MALSDKLYPNVNIILENISKSEGFVEPNINCYRQLGKGQGFMGDIFFVKIEDKSSRKKLELIIKQSTASNYVRNNFPIHVLYQNESQFYKKIWPEFVNLQTVHLGSLVFDNLAKCYATDLQRGSEYLILENLNTRNFSNVSKSNFFDKEHAEYVLTKYGQFHGLSFAYKSKNPDQFRVMCELLIPYWVTTSTIDLFQFLMEKGVKDCLSYLEPSTDGNIIKKLEPYVKDVVTIFQDSTRYEGKHGVIVQGDCWSNNLLFKYKDSGEIVDMKLIDFQISNLGSVVNDLSYCLYAGGTKDIFDNFDQYLRIYHDSLTDTCMQFGCTDFITFEELKKEWKQHGKFGFILGLMLIRSKLSEDVNQDDLAHTSNGSSENEHPENARRADTESIRKKTLELVFHLYESDFL